MSENTEQRRPQSRRKTAPRAAVAVSRPKVNETRADEYRYQVLESLKVIPSGPGWVNLAEIAE